jgi:hypothetical protein
VIRVIFDEPQDASPLVAELYRWWYRLRGLDSTRLLVETFILMDPWWTLRLGAIPFWAKFNTAPAAEGLERYLDAAEPYDQIDLTLFSHGVSSLGLAPIERWRGILARARRHGSLLGGDPKAYPADFAVFARYHPALHRIPSRCPMPTQFLTVEQLAEFLAQSADRFVPEWQGRRAANAGDCRSAGSTLTDPTPWPLFSVPRHRLLRHLRRPPGHRSAAGHATGWANQVLNR